MFWGDVVVAVLKAGAILALFAALIWFGINAKPPPPPVVRDAAPGALTLTRWHDPEHPVTCWVSQAGGVACLPDAAFE
jgi:hypothetical protein